MKSQIISSICLAALAACGGTESPSTTEPITAGENTAVVDTAVEGGEKVAPKQRAFAYPTPRRENVVDNYHGTEVVDAYRWLEDADSAETAAWVQAQNKVTQAYLADVPKRDSLTARLTELWDYEKYGVPHKEGSRYFYSKNDGLQDQNVLYWTDSLKVEPKVALDPNTFSKDGTVALAGHSVSENGKYIAYGLQNAGSDWATWHVREVQTGKVLQDKLEWIKFSSASWNKQSTGFYYGRFPKPEAKASLTAPNFGNKLYFHKIGTKQSEDTLVFESPNNPKWMSGGQVSEDGRYLILSTSKGTDNVNQVRYIDLKAKGKKAAPRVLINNFDAMYNFVGNQGPVFWFHTDNSAPRGRVIRIDTRKPGKKSWQEIVPQSDATLESASLIGGKLVTTYLRDASSEIIVRNIKTGKELNKVKLPGIGSVYGFNGRNKDKETFYSFSNFITPTSIYRYDMRTGKSSLFKAPNVKFTPTEYQLKQVFYPSKDGTKIPMFIVHKKGLSLDGKNATLLYGYGGFNISITPRFSVAWLTWMEMGGVLAIPNLRGGGEYGEEWHKAGTKLVKQNVFDDFIAAAEWLIAKRYTSSPKLAISGRSNGGLLVGASMTQRPELFGAALPAVGVMDMLRFHKFTIGWAWVDDYGSSDNAEEFKALYAYSPYHNLKPAKYPATMVMTADHDDRVVPAHSFKFAAELQHAHTGDTPVLIRIETKAGHGAGKPTSKRIEDIVDTYSFLIKALHLN